MKNKEIEELLNDIKTHDYKVLNREDYSLLLSCIEQLEKKIDQYENPEDLTLFYMWLDTKAKDKMKQLEKRNKELYEGFMATQEELTDYATKNEHLENKNKENSLLLIEFQDMEQRIKQLENNRDKAITLLEESAKYREPVLIEKQILNILKGDNK